MNLLERRKLQKNINGIIDANRSFTDFLDGLFDGYYVSKEDTKNLGLLQEHLTNMTVIFAGMSDKVKNK